MGDKTGFVRLGHIFPLCTNKLATLNHIGQVSMHPNIYARLQEYLIAAMNS